MSRAGPMRALSTAEAVAEYLEKMIIEGSLRSGDYLLSERDMASKLDVSRPTLREAVKIMSDRGFLVKEARGTRVSQIGEKIISDPLIIMLKERSELSDDYFEFRAIVESSAAALAAERANEHDIRRIEHCITRIKEAHLAVDPAEEAEADAQLHLAIYEISHNIVLLHIMRSLSGSLRDDVAQNRERLFSLPHIRDVLLEQHSNIAHAIMSKDPTGARLATQHHISYLRLANREIRESQLNLEVSLRRIDNRGLIVRN